MQTIGVLDSIAMQWPANLAWLFDIADVFMFDLQGFSFSCLLGHSFAAQYWCSIVVPIFIVASSAIAFGITSVAPVPEAWKMKVNAVRARERVSKVSGRNSSRALPSLFRGAVGLRCLRTDLCRSLYPWTLSQVAAFRRP